MNQPIYATIAEAAPIAADIRKVYEATKYALTRRRDDGVVEFATHRGWSIEAAQASMRDRAEQAEYGFDKKTVAQGHISKVTIAVYEGAGIDAIDGGEHIVAARGVTDGETSRKVNFITDVGQFGRPREITDRAWQAVTYNPADEGAFARVQEKVTQPTYKIGQRHYAIRQEITPAVRTMHIEP